MCEHIFQDLKRILASLSIMRKPKASLPLLVYITTIESTINTALVQELAGVQYLVYFVSRSLQDLETKYQMVEKLALPLVNAARRLRPYFQIHHVIVKTNYPIQRILQKLDLAGRKSAWTVELSKFNICYELHRPIKA